MRIINIPVVLFRLLLLLPCPLFLIPQSGGAAVSDELFSKAGEYYRSSEFEKARIIYEDLAKEEDFSLREQVLFMLGKSCYALKLPDRSYDAFSALLGEYPRTVHYQEGLEHMLDILQERKEHEKALSLIDASPPEIRKTAKMKERYLMFLEYRNFYAKALEYLDMNFTPSSWTWNKKIQYLKSMGDHDRIIRVVRSNMSRENELESYRILADAYESLGDYRLSLTWHEKLHEKTGKIDHLLNGLRMLMARPLPAEARILKEKIFGLMGRNRNTYLLLSAFYRENGFYPDLILLYDEAKKGGFDFTKEKITAYEVLGQYGNAVVEYVQLLNENEYLYVLDRLYRLFQLEDEKSVIQGYLFQMEKKYPEKAEWLLKLQLELFVRIQDREGLAGIIPRYLKKADRFDLPFLENVMNLMYRQMNYREIGRMYGLLTSRHRELISPLMRVRYAQALYFEEAYDESFKLLEGLNQGLLKEEVDYYRALNLIRLKKDRDAVPLLSDYRNRFPFYLELFRIRMRRGECALARSELKKDASSFEKFEALYLDILGSLCASEPALLIRDLDKYMELYSQTVYANDLGLMLFLFKRDLSDDEKSRLTEFLREVYAQNYDAVPEEKLETIKREDLRPLLDYYRARILFLRRRYKESLALCQKLALGKNYVRPYVLELTGFIHYAHLNDKASGLKYFRTVLAEYPNYLNVNTLRKLIQPQK